MVSKGKVYKELDRQIKSILLSTNGWLVGSSIEQICNGEEVRDYDIIVPSRDLFRKIVVNLVANHQCIFNSYGGVKCEIDAGVELDIWCEELSHFIHTANKMTYAYNHERCKLLKLE